MIFINFCLDDPEKENTLNCTSINIFRKTWTLKSHISNMDSQVSYI